ncbi:serine/threonine protein kinase [Pendulispora rubella]|uniref:Serine/threonine protein kinase n=1 Tax=Pendulispora rubella TaxID=2741070 RepID=A0ABZ2L7B9_9BACT
MSLCAQDGGILLPDAAFTGVERAIEPGLAVGEYRIEEKIGEGGFGTVYRAIHPLIGKAAAIKVLNRQSSANPRVVTRFIAEARAVNQIRHRNIVDIFSFGALDDGRPYLVMELLEGTTLEKYLRIEKGRLTPEEAIPILRGVARALDAAHAAGIIHRDLKPDNVFLSFDEDGRPLPKLLDFGVAKLRNTEGVLGDKTRTGIPIGTPCYMSPEQSRGKAVDHRTDIYSFGVLTHELLTGKLPFFGSDVVDLLLKQTNETPPPMSSVCRAVPPALDAPVLQMLEKDPASRPDSAGDALELLATAAKVAGFRVSTAGALAPDLPISQKRHAPPTPRGREVATLEMAETMTVGHAVVDMPPARRSAIRLTRAAFGGAGALLTIVLLLMGAGLIGQAKREVAWPSPSSYVAALPPPASAPADVPAKEVSVIVHATPLHATVWQERDNLGNAPGPFRLPRTLGTTRLTVKADGYKPSDIIVDTSSNVSVLIALTKWPVRPVEGAKIPARPPRQRGEIPTDIHEQ